MAEFLCDPLLFCSPKSFRARGVSSQNGATDDRSLDRVSGKSDCRRSWGAPPVRLMPGKT